MNVTTQGLIGDLRRLADALERRREMSRYPGIGAPERIRFFQGESELKGFGDNPVLLDAIVGQIRQAWPALSAKAFEDVDNLIGALSGLIRAALADMAAAPDAYFLVTDYDRLGGKMQSTRAEAIAEAERLAASFPGNRVHVLEPVFSAFVAAPAEVES